MTWLYNEWLQHTRIYYSCDICIYLFVQSGLMCVIHVDDTFEWIPKTSHNVRRSFRLHSENFDSVTIFPIDGILDVVQSTLIKSRWCPGPESNSLHPRHDRHLRFGVPTSSHLVFVDVCCLFVKLCLLCFKESRILSTLWNGKHWIQRGQWFDLWTQVSRILVRRVSSRAKMVSVRAPEENQGTHFHAMRWLLQAVDLRTSLKIWKRRHPLWSTVSWIWISQYSRVVLCFFPTSWRLPT